MPSRLRFADLKARRIVNNRATLSNWQKKYGFPLGQLTSPNCRTWDEETEINPWLASRPTALKQTPKGDWKRGRPRKASTEERIKS